MAEDRSRWQPLSRAEFRQLQREQRLQDRRGRTWTVTGAAREVDGIAYVVVRSGDLVRRVDERYCDDYYLAAGDGPGP